MTTGERSPGIDEFDEVYSIVHGVLAEHFDARVVEGPGPDGRAFFLEAGSVLANVIVRRLASGRVVVSVLSLLAASVESTPELFSYVATHADAYFEGHLGLRPPDPDAARFDIFLSHDLFGTQVTAAGVRDAIGMLLERADSIDDELVVRFGDQPR